MLGVSAAGIYGEIAWAEEGQGAWLGGERIQVSRTASLRDAILSTGNLKTLAASPQWANFGRLVGGVSRLRGYGDFVHYHLLARGALDVVVESDVNILDIAALCVIVREAGGRFTDLSGGPVGLATTTVLASNATAARRGRERRRLSLPSGIHAMKRATLAALVLAATGTALMLGACGRKAAGPAPTPFVTDEARRAVSAIDAGFLSSRIAEFSSDDMEGRRTATPGDEKARRLARGADEGHRPRARRSGR